MSSSDAPGRGAEDGVEEDEDEKKTLKYHLLGPSLTKAGQDRVDQSKVSDIIYNASKGSKFFNREEVRDRELTQKIERILARKRKLEQQDLSTELQAADRMICELEMSRDLSQSIVHIDCDAFYAAVEELERPDIKNIPFAVGGGVLTTCNYVARQFGCRSGMAGFVAKKLCPNLTFIRPNFQKYAAKAEEVREVLARYDSRYESASIDEAYLNITEHCRVNNLQPAEAIEEMRREIHQRTGLTVSAGIAANTKLAKICSNKNKPNGQYLLPSDRASIMKFMRELPTRKVNGIGRVLERQLAEIGVKTCGQIYDQRQYLNLLFGAKTFEFLISCLLGLGRTKIQPAEEYERKSVGTESTFQEMSDPVKIREKLRWTADELEKDLSRIGCRGRTLCLKIKLHTFEVVTRQTVLPKAICSGDDLYRFSLPVLTKLEQELPSMKMRLMGLRCTHLVSTIKPDTMAFFGFKKTMAGLSSPPRCHTGMELPPARMDEHEDRDLHLLENNQHSNQRHSEGSEKQADDLATESYNAIAVPNPRKRTPETPAQWWDCPVCLRPQDANDKEFNDHIDLCLSRRTIRDAVQGQICSSVQDTQRGPKRQRSEDKRKGKDQQKDLKQQTLSFS